MTAIVNGRRMHVDESWHYNRFIIDIEGVIIVSDKVAPCVYASSPSYNEPSYITGWNTWNTWFVCGPAIAAKVLLED